MAVVGNDLDNFILELTRKERNLGEFIDKQIKIFGGVWILRTIKLRLFNQGIGGDGTKLVSSNTTPESTARYQKLKSRKGIRANPMPNFVVKRNFFKSMYIKSRFGLIQVLTNDEAKDEPQKTETLIEKYGEQIFTLTVKEQEDVARKLSEKIAADFNKLKIPTIKFT